MSAGENLIEFLREAAPFVGLAMLGGVFRLVWKGCRSVPYALSCISMAGFAGFLAYGFMTLFHELPVGFESCVMGISGFAGGKAVEALQRRLLGRLETGAPDMTGCRGPRERG